MWFREVARLQRTMEGNAGRVIEALELKLKIPSST
jgi:hypothetical protein